MATKTTRAPSESLPIPVEMVERRIYLIRGHKVMLDSDLSELYGVTTGNLNKAVTRNIDRFPEDFMWQLTEVEHRALRFHIGILKRGRHSKYVPRVFTEQGVAMLSSVLRSKRAVIVNITIMRAFVRLREVLATHKDLAGKMVDLEREQKAQGKMITDVFEAIQKLIEPAPGQPRRAIGFEAPKKYPKK